MTDRLRIVIAARGAKEFSTLHNVCEQAGHLPVAYVYSRSRKPAAAPSPDVVGAVGEMLQAAPPGMDFLLPGTASGLADILTGYRSDLLLVCGFNWRIPSSVLRIPTHGALNIHPSMLPKYRGPEPIQWAIRRGDTEFGITLHRMDDGFDTGNVIVQQDGIPIDDEPTPELLWHRMEPVIRELLPQGLDRVAGGDLGEPQDETRASYAGPMEPEFLRIDWGRNAREIHNQVRTFRAMRAGSGPIAQVGDRWLKVLRTRTTPGTGLQVHCADGPLWIIEHAAVPPPGNSE